MALAETQQGPEGGSPERLPATGRMDSLAAGLAIIENAKKPAQPGPFNELPRLNEKPVKTPPPVTPADKPFEMPLELRVEPAEIKAEPAAQTQTVETHMSDPLAALDGLVGLARAKAQVRKTVNMAKLAQERDKAGLPHIETTHHMVLSPAIRARARRRWRGSSGGFTRRSAS